MQANKFEIEFMKKYLESFDAMSSVPVDYFDVNSAEDLGISEHIREYMSRERHVHERRIMERDRPEEYAELLSKEIAEANMEEEEFLRQLEERFGDI